MIEPSPVPRRVKAPSWLDLRLVLGLAMVLAAVLGGALVIARAQRTRPVLAATRDLAAGTVLTASDVAVVRVQVGERTAALYAADASAVVGKQLQRGVQSGELIARAVTRAPRPMTTLSVPFAQGSAPTLHAGQRIEIWLSSPRCRSVVLLPAVTVQSVHNADAGFSSGAGQVTVISVEPALADRVVAALDLDQAHVRAGVLTGSSTPDVAGGIADVSRCAPATSTR